MSTDPNTLQLAGETQTKLIIVMGVSGCGKSTVASALARKLNYQFIEADDFHSAQNRKHMRSGKALNDEMRAPWIASMHTHLSKLAQQNVNSVLSFSGLKAEYRARIKSVPMSVTTLHLQGDKKLIQQRMQRRLNHFMPVSLLDSQYHALENPNQEPNTYALDIDCSIDELVERALTHLTRL